MRIHRSYPLAALLILSSMAPAAKPPVVLDGTLGPAAVLSRSADGVIHVEPQHGRQREANLFHSFSRLNVPRSGSVAIDPPGPTAPPVARVFLRVTGPELSSIEGSLRSMVPGADLYLLNPNGVFVGPGGEIRALGGGVHVTTASEVRFPGEITFSASPSLGEVLSTQPPVAYGFLHSKPASIVLRGGKIEPIGTGLPVSLVGGELSISNQSVVVALFSRLDLLSIAGLATVQLDEGIPSLLDSAERGRIAFRDNPENIGVGSILNGFVGESTNQAQLRVVARDLELFNSVLRADNSGSDVVPAMDIDLTGRLAVAASAALVADRNADGAGGAVRISANEVRIDGTDRRFTATGAPLLTGIAANRIGGMDRGGDVVIAANDIQIWNGAEVLTGTAGLGRAGDVRLRTQGLLRIEGPLSGVRAEVADNAPGDGGGISIEARQIALAHGGEISAVTRGFGQGGSIQIDASALRIDGAGFAGFTGLATNTQPPTAQEAAAKGRGGDIHVGSLQRPLRRVELRQGGGIASRSFTGGRSGNVTIVTDLLSVDGRGTNPGSTTGVNVDTEQRPRAAGGNLRVVGPSRIELVQANLTASASKDGGNISIENAGLVSLLDSAVQAAAGDDGGNILIQADSVALNRSLVDGRFGLNGNAAAQRVIVQINANSLFVRSTDSTILARDPVLPPDVDLISELAGVQASPLDSSETLTPSCELQALRGFSTFIVSVRGGLRGDVQGGIFAPP